MESLSSATSLIAVIQLTRAITRICRSYLSINKIQEPREYILGLKEEIAALSETLEPLERHLHKQNPTKASTAQNLVENIAKCSAILKSLKDKIDPETTQTLMMKWGFQYLEWPMKVDEVTKIIREIERYKTSFWLSLLLNQTQSTHLLINQKIDLSRLHIAKGAAFNDYGNQHTECLPGTRVELLRKIDHWIETHKGKCIFWLTGMAGTGKSTVARTISSRLKEQGILGASFFFKKGEQDRGNAKLLFSTLAKQLGGTIPQLLPSIQNAIKDDPDISGRVPKEQFEKLILQPLISLNSGSTSIMLIVIDALDECDQVDHVRDILELLPYVQESRSVQLRFLLTSRPDLPIRLGFQGTIDHHQHLMIHKISSPVIEHDIRLYFENEFLRLQQERDLPTNWPGVRTINTLVERAIPSFTSITTLFRFISDDRWSATERLEVILSDQTKYVAKMEGIYTPILNRLLSNENEEESRQLVHGFKNTIGILILLATPLSANSLAKLLKMETDKIQKQFKLFHSVLDVPARPDEPVRILHISFRDFILDNKQKGKPFWVDGRLVHEKLTVQCLKVMQDGHYGLRKNICNLQNDTTQRDNVDNDTINRCLPSELQYACRYWVHHLVQSHSSANELSTHALSFLESHFLHWVEAMSLLGIISEVIEMIQRLRLAMQAERDHEISGFLHDAWHFILRNQQIADTAPLQLYSAGLVFISEDSIIRRNFKNELSTWNQLSTVKRTWNGRSSWLNLVSFSPNGQLLASGADDNTIELWDPRTGELRQTLKGHSSWITSVEFSPDGQMLASAACDDTVKLWDPRTGELRHTLDGHFNEVHNATFLPDGQLFGSGFDNNTVMRWDARTGELLELIK
ncbi:WD40-repeat-containing domain protein [Penicillium waksmanii]|uniref:WD40-repeat-containing domain protein n=1 Tax=Penicillium waksmanii TaxID=69791 RepID=UPI002547A4B0|nr:WD40-repeat-containing domain protein [Penicillium waksmanii]KAJ5973878.1 WD40-repeat-containing domain protein [Penicillium waksmanii]